MEERTVVVGINNKYNIPIRILDLIYLPGTRPSTRTSLCSHEVLLSPTAEAHAHKIGANVICSECVESYTILHGSPVSQSMAPGALQEMEAHYGKEETDRIVETYTPEIERKTGSKFDRE